MTPWLLAYLFSFIPGFSSDTEWRLLLGLGAIPGAVVVVLSYIEMQLDNHRAAIDTNVREGWLPVSVTSNSTATTSSLHSSPVITTENDGVSSPIDETELVSRVITRSLPYPPTS